MYDFTGRIRPEINKKSPPERNTRVLQCVISSTLAYETRHCVSILHGNTIKLGFQRNMNFKLSKCMISHMVCCQRQSKLFHGMLQTITRDRGISLLILCSPRFACILTYRVKAFELLITLVSVCGMLSTSTISKTLGDCEFWRFLPQNKLRILRLLSILGKTLLLALKEASMLAVRHGRWFVRLKRTLGVVHNM